MPPKSKTKRHGSLTSFDSFRVSKPIAKSNLKNVKNQISAEHTNHAKPPLTQELSIEDSTPRSTSGSPKEASPEVEIRPQLDEHDRGYIQAAERILDAKQTAIIHTNPNTIEIILRDFDLTSKYGPCVGLSRMDRFKRAQKMGMDPPEVVGEILATQQAQEKSEYKNDLFYGRL